MKKMIALALFACLLGGVVGCGSSTTKPPAATPSK